MNATPDDKIIDRIRKLLALSKSANKHEACLAAARAADLMAAHQLSTAMLIEAEPDPIGAHCIETSRQRVQWKGQLAAAVAYSNGCRCYWSGKAIDEVWHKQLMFVGRQADVDTASYLYQYLCAEISRLADKAWKSRVAIVVPHHREPARSWKNAFRLSAAVTIGDRLRRSRDESFAAARSSGTEDMSRALLRIADKETAIDAYMQGLNLRRSPTARVTNASGFCAGADAGGSMDLGGDKSRLSPGRLCLGDGDSR